MAALLGGQQWLITRPRPLGSKSDSAVRRNVTLLGCTTIPPMLRLDWFIVRAVGLSEQ